MKIDTKQNIAIKAFEAQGYEVVKMAEHIKMRNEQGKTISLPNHKRIKGSVLSRICNEQGIDKKVFFLHC